MPSKLVLQNLVSEGDSRRNRAELGQTPEKMASAKSCLRLASVIHISVI